MRLNGENEKALVYVPDIAYDNLQEQWHLFLEQDDGDESIEYIENRFRNKFNFESNFHEQ